MAFAILRCGIVKSSYEGFYDTGAGDGFIATTVKGPCNVTLQFLSSTPITSYQIVSERELRSGFTEYTNTQQQYTSSNPIFAIIKSFDTSLIRANVI